MSRYLVAVAMNPPVRPTATGVALWTARSYSNYNVPATAVEGGPMTGVLDGVKVLDLSWGIAGPMATMLLADNGAAVTKIEPPDGDPFRSISGYQVWSRGKRSAVLDLKEDEDRATFLRLLAQTDVLVESFEPSAAKRLGLDYASLRDLNSR